MPILRHGNHHSLASASKVAVIADARDYFAALAQAAARARRSIDMVAWDLNTRVRLIRDERAGNSEGRPTFGELMQDLVRRNPDLHVRILCWKPAFVYLFERQSLADAVRALRHPRIHLRFDDTHPFGACHHQKIVVIDDSVAFSGGLDPSRDRWDSPKHRPNDRRRENPDGERYRPFHDVQMAVEGDVARALGDLVRERWYRATGERLEPVPRDGESRWPPLLPPDFSGVPVAISRTEPAYAGRTEIREVERLFLDSFEEARRLVYLEAQYFTSSRIATALCERLRNEHGPEVVLVLSQHHGNLKEDASMGVLRYQALDQLKRADRHGRLRCVYPLVPGIGDSFVNVHSKVSIIDDRFLRVGSANLSNRSLGLDTECDLAVESDEREVRDRIARVRRRLVGEHLGLAPEEVGRLEEEHGGSLAAVIDARKGFPRRLEPLPLESPGSLGKLLGKFADPPGPLF